jgi:hypothetical protein
MKDFGDVDLCRFPLQLLAKLAVVLVYVLRAGVLPRRRGFWHSASAVSGTHT